MHDVQLSFINDEPRPAFIFDDVKGAILYDVQAQTASGASTIMLRNSTDIEVSIAYHAPGGKAGEVAGKLLTPVFEKMLQKDVEGFKEYIEAGVVAAS